MWAGLPSIDARLPRLPAYVSRSRLTIGPFCCEIQCRTKFDPMNPAPPVTRIGLALCVIWTNCIEVAPESLYRGLSVCSPNCQAGGMETAHAVHAAARRRRRGTKV